MLKIQIKVNRQEKTGKTIHTFTNDLKRKSISEMFVKTPQSKDSLGGSLNGKVKRETECGSGPRVSVERSVERSVYYSDQTRNELPSTAGADHAYVPPPRSGGGGTKTVI